MKVSGLLLSTLLLQSTLAVAGGGEPTPPPPPPPEPTEVIERTPLSLIPEPDQIDYKVSSQDFTLTAETALIASPELAVEKGLLQEYLSLPTGFALDNTSGSSEIRLQLNSSLSAESYRIDISQQQVLIEGGDRAGVFYGIQTLRQLLPDEVFSPHIQRNVVWKARAVVIEDTPRYHWRGLLLDSARWFQPKAYIKDMLDKLATYKVNKFHWHLTDDNGWRIEIKQYPRLTSVGATRSESLLWNHERDIYWTLENVIGIDFQEYSDGRPHSGFYSQDDIREIVAYAAARHIEIIPEIDLPGHAQAAVAAYPDILSSRTDGVVPEPRKEIAGISEYVIHPGPQSLQFFKNVLDEVMDLFPGQFIHLGGDEVELEQWAHNPEIQQMRTDLGLASDSDLVGHFLKQLYAHVRANNRTPLGWNEVLDFNVAPQDVDIMFWRAIDQGDYSRRALNAGHHVIYTPNTILYMHGCQASEQHLKERDCLLAPNTIETVYNYDPIQADVADNAALHPLVRGIQAALWENGHQRHGNYEALYEILFPRMLAVAEAGWTDNKNYDRFSTSLTSHKRKLDMAGVDYFNYDFGDSIELLARSNGYCLDVSGSRTSNGNSIVSYLCNGTNAERWYYDRKNQWLRNRMDRDKCLGFNGTIGQGTNVVIKDCDASTRLSLNLNQERIHSAANTDYSVDQTTRVIGAEVHMWANHGGSNQKWRNFYQAPRLFQMKNRANGRCLSLQGRAQVVFADCNADNEQLWYYREITGALVNRTQQGLCLGINSARTGYALINCNSNDQSRLLKDGKQWISESGRQHALASSGTALVFNPVSETESQQWDLLYQVAPASGHNTGDEYVSQHFELRDKRSGRCLDIANGSTADGANIRIWNCNGSDAQAWYYEQSTGFIRSRKDNGKCLDMGGNYSNGANIQLYRCVNSNNLRFDWVGNSIRPRANHGFALDANGTQEGANVSLWQSNDQPQQQWTRHYR